MKKLSITTIFILWSVASTFANPVMSGADPDVDVFGTTYWMYPTVPRGGSVFKAYSSDDLQHWQDRGVVLDLKTVSWIAEPGHIPNRPWAPSILSAKGRYFLYYSVGPQGQGQPSRIGVATADRPEGPFVDSGAALVTSTKGFEAIDPMAFTDPKSGITYLYAGGSAGAKLRIWELGEDRISLKREIQVATPSKFTEGAFMHVRNGVYYLSYSHGSWATPAYSVHYATASSPTGPWTYKGCVLSSDTTHQGPGHHAFFKNPSTGEWFIVYHRWETTQTTGKLPGGRQIAIEPITYAADGTIQPIRMTDNGPAASPIGSAKTAETVKR